MSPDKHRLAQLRKLWLALFGTGLEPRESLDSWSGSSGRSHWGRARPMSPCWCTGALLLNLYFSPDPVPGESKTHTRTSINRRMLTEKQKHISLTHAYQYIHQIYVSHPHTLCYTRTYTCNSSWPSGYIKLHFSVSGKQLDDYQKEIFMWRLILRLTHGHVMMMIWIRATFTCSSGDKVMQVSAGLAWFTAHFWIDLSSL